MLLVSVVTRICLTVHAAGLAVGLTANQTLRFWGRMPTTGMPAERSKAISSRHSTLPDSISRSSSASLLSRMQSRKRKPSDFRLISKKEACRKTQVNAAASFFLPVRSRFSSAVSRRSCPRPAEVCISRRCQFRPRERFRLSSLWRFPARSLLLHRNSLPPRPPPGLC